MSGGPHAALLYLGMAMLLAACGAGPQSPASALERGHALLAAGRTGDAAEQLRLALERWPEDAHLRELQGDVDLAAGRGHLAEIDYGRALRADPRNRQLAVKAARAVLQQGRALDALRQASARADDPPDVQAGFRLVHLEARLALPTNDFTELRREAESLWRSTATADAGMGAVADRLAALARDQPAVEAGRQHAQCRIPDEVAVEAAAAPAAVRPVLKVGPGQRLRRPSDAAAVAGNGAIVEIEPGSYDGDVVVWTQDDLTLRGAGRRPRLRGGPRTAEDKGIWVIKGNRTTVENLEFSGARSSHRNGSGIRLEGSGLTVRGCLFTDNQMGILTSNNTPDSEILISRSEFRANRSGAVEGELGHNIYIGRAAAFTLEFSYVHGAVYGHNVKSRARVNRILYNRIADEAAGRASYLVDLPEGGHAEIIGNELQKSAFAENHPVVSFGEEAHTHLHPDGAVVMAYNTFYSGAIDAMALKLASKAPVTLVANAFAGVPMAMVVGDAEAGRNTSLVEGGMVNPAAFDFTLTANSPAIDAGVAPGGPDAGAAAAAFEYVHPMRARPRPRVWVPDAGAHEYCGGGPGEDAGRKPD